MTSVVTIIAAAWPEVTQLFKGFIIGLGTCLHKTTFAVMPRNYI